MPHRLDGLFTILASAVASILACLAASVPDLSTLTGHTILNDAQMRFACIIGALGGAILNVAIFPPRVATRHAIAIKFVASGLSGMIFAPLAIRWLRLTPDFDIVIFISAAVALVAIRLIRLAIPLIEKKAEKRMRDDDDPRTGV